MAKLTLSDLSNLNNQTSAVATINANNVLIENALEITLSRDGTTPNTMVTDLDMNSYNILNLPDPTTNQEPITLAYGTANYGNSLVNSTAAAASATAAASSATTAATSAATATTQATTATTQATAAAASATTATTQASNAATSATSAATSATQATNAIGAIRWNFSTTTSMADPSSGNFRLNNAAIASTTAIAVSATDALSNSVSAAVNTWDDSSSSVKGQIILRKLSAATTYALFNITSSLTDNSTWLQINVTYVGGSGSFSAADVVGFDFVRTGDAGSGSVAGMSTHGIPVASGTTSIGSSIALTDGQLIVGQTGADPLAKTVSGDFTLAASGAATVKTSLTLVTPILGTPTSGTLTNCTGLPVAGIVASTSTALGVGSVELGNASDTTLARVSAGLVSVEGTTLGWLQIPQNSQSAAYTTVLADSGKHIYHPVGDTNNRAWLIDSNANVAYPVGTAITFINRSPNNVTINVTSDTLTFSPTGGTGIRTLAQYGVATAIKVLSTEWIISGTNLS